MTTAAERLYALITHQKVKDIIAKNDELVIGEVIVFERDLLTLLKERECLAMFAQTVRDYKREDVLTPMGEIQMYKTLAFNLLTEINDDEQTPVKGDDT